MEPLTEEENFDDLFEKLDDDYVANCYQTLPGSSHNYIRQKNTSFSGLSSINQSRVVKDTLDIEFEQVKLEARDYQIDIVEKAKNRNSIIFMDTGTGKTIVSIYLNDHYMKKYQKKKQIIYLANTQLLVEQQKNQIKRFLPKIDQSHNLNEINVLALHGGITDMVWESFYQSGMLRSFAVFICTPQYYLNALRRGYMSLDNVCLLIIDECQHTTKDHPFSLLMQEFWETIPTIQYPYIIGLTASPVKTNETREENVRKRLLELCYALDSNFVLNEAMMLKSLNQKNPRIFIHPYSLDYRLESQINGSILELADQQELLSLFLDQKLLVIDNKSHKLFMNLLKVFSNAANTKSKFLSVYISKIKNRCLAVILELGRYALYLHVDYLIDKINQKCADPSYALSKRDEGFFLTFVGDLLLKFKNEYMPKDPKIEDLHTTKKIQELLGILKSSIIESQSSIKKDQDPVSMVFVSRRYIAKLVTDLIDEFGENYELKSNFAIGHNNTKKGKPLMNPTLTLLGQMNTISDFRRKKFNVLVSTSLCEEGFDIPDCNLVVSFQEPLSITALIQAKGRARKPDSSYFILIPEEKKTLWEGRLDLSLKIMIAIKEISMSLAKMSDDQLKLFLKEHRKQEMQPDKYFEMEMPTVECQGVLNTNWSIELIRTYCQKILPSSYPVFINVTSQEPDIHRPKLYCSIACMPLESPMLFKMGKPLNSTKESQKSATYESSKELGEKGFLDSHFYPKFMNGNNLLEFNNVIDWKKLSNITGVSVRKRYGIQNEMLSNFFFEPLAKNYKQNPETKNWIGYLYTFNNEHLNKEPSKQQMGKAKGSFGLISPVLHEEQLKLPKNGFAYVREIQLSEEQYKELLKIQRYLILSIRGFDGWHCSWYLGQEYNNNGFYSNPKDFPPLTHFDIYTKNEVDLKHGNPCFPLIVCLDAQGSNINWNKSKRILQYCDLLCQVFGFYNQDASALTEEKSREFIQQMREHSFQGTNSRGSVIQIIPYLTTIFATQIDQLSNTEVNMTYFPLRLVLEGLSDTQPLTYNSPTSYLLEYPLSLEEIRNFNDVEKTLMRLKRDYAFSIYTSTLKTSTEMSQKAVLCYEYSPPNWILTCMRQNPKFQMPKVQDEPVEEAKSKESNNSNSNPFDGEQANEKLFAQIQFPMSFPNKFAVMRNQTKRIYGEVLYKLLCGLENFIHEKNFNMFKNLKFVGLKYENDTELYTRAFKARLLTFTAGQDDALLFYQDSYFQNWESMWEFSLHYIKCLLSDLYVYHNMDIQLFVSTLHAWGFSKFSSIKLNMVKALLINKALQENESISNCLESAQEKVGYRFNYTVLLFHAFIPSEVRQGLAIAFSELIQKRFLVDRNQSIGEITSSSNAEINIELKTTLELKYYEVWELVDSLNTQWNEDVSNERLYLLGTYLYNLFVMEVLNEEEEKRMKQGPYRSADWTYCCLRHVRKPQFINTLVKDMNLKTIQLNLMKPFTSIIPNLADKSYARTPDDQTFFALIAAVFIDSGFDMQAARSLFAKFIGAKLPNFLSSNFDEQDPVYYFKKICKDRKIEPMIEKVSHQDYRKPGTFEYKLTLNGEVLSKMYAPNFEEVEEALHVEAIKTLKKALK